MESGSNAQILISTKGIKFRERKTSGNNYEW